MSYDWHEFLEFAERLKKTPTKPGPSVAALRSAASRAYYAVYHLAEAFASRERFVKTGHSEDHVDLWEYFIYGASLDSRRREIGDSGILLRNYRNQADYDDRLPQAPPFHAGLSIALANHILEELQALQGK